MTRSDLTHLYFLLDRSGSMQTIKADTEGGFDAFIAEQRSGDGDCRVTLAQFDNEYEVVYTARSLADVPPLTLVPRGGTALLDAIGRLVTDAGAELSALTEEDRPGTVIVAIMTDGEENQSREWTHAAIRSLVEQQTTVYAWQFLYMGADQDAVEVGASIGVGAEHSVTYARGNAQQAFAATAGKVSRLRTARVSDPTAMAAGYSPAERASLADDGGSAPVQLAPRTRRPR